MLYRLLEAMSMGSLSSSRVLFDLAEDEPRDFRGDEKMSPKGCIPYSSTVALSGRTTPVFLQDESPR